jgi:hypothetical protein
LNAKAIPANPAAQNVGRTSKPWAARKNAVVRDKITLELLLITLDSI